MGQNACEICGHNASTKPLFCLNPGGKVLRWRCIPDLKVFKPEPVRK